MMGATLENKDMQIGWEGIIIEFDETKLGKREYNRGHKVEGVGYWLESSEQKKKNVSVFKSQTEAKKPILNPWKNI